MSCICLKEGVRGRKGGERMVRVSEGGRERGRREIEPARTHANASNPTSPPINSPLLLILLTLPSC